MLKAIQILMMVVIERGRCRKRGWQRSLHEGKEDEAALVDGYTEEGAGSDRYQPLLVHSN
ncbi:MAG: hypothetical protein RBJ76_07650 [Stenomitos frigidus ULC029]